MADAVGRQMGELPVWCSPDDERHWTSDAYEKGWIAALDGWGCLYFNAQNSPFVAGYEAGRRRVAWLRQCDTIGNWSA